MRHYALNQVGAALAGSGTVFASEDDPELVREAVPFSLKLMEAVLAETPRHEGLLLAAASDFTQYAYAFVQQEADEDLAAAEVMRARARRLYLRGRDYGLRALAVRHAGLADALRADAKAAVSQAARRDVPALYWTAAAWAAAISLSKDNPDLIADLPIVGAMMERALALDEGYDQGALHSFFITYEMVRPGGGAQAVERAKRHCARAVELSGGMQAAPWVSLAEDVCVQQQDRKGFRAALDKALAVDPNARPEHRLVNLVMQRRARWLLSRADDLFLKPDEAGR